MSSNAPGSSALPRFVGGVGSSGAGPSSGETGTTLSGGLGSSNHGTQGAANVGMTSAAGQGSGGGGSATVAPAAMRDPPHWGVYLHPSIFRVHATGRDVLWALHRNGSLNYWRAMTEDHARRYSSSGGGGGDANGLDEELAPNATLHAGAATGMASAMEVPMASASSSLPPPTPLPLPSSGAQKERPATAGSPSTTTVLASNRLPLPSSQSSATGPVAGGCSGSLPPSVASAPFLPVLPTPPSSSMSTGAAVALAAAAKPSVSPPPPPPPPPFNAMRNPLQALRQAVNTVPQLISFDFRIYAARPIELSDSDRARLHRDPLFLQLHHSRPNLLEVIVPDANSAALPSLQLPRVHQLSPTDEQAKTQELQELLRDPRQQSVACALQMCLYGARAATEYRMHCMEPDHSRAYRGAVVEKVIGGGEEGTGLFASPLLSGLELALLTMRTGEEAAFFMSAPQTFLYSLPQLLSDEGMGSSVGAPNASAYNNSPTSSYPHRNMPSAAVAPYTFSPQLMSLVRHSANNVVFVVLQLRRRLPAVRVPSPCRALTQYFTMTARPPIPAGSSAAAAATSTNGSGANANTSGGGRGVTSPANAANTPVTSSQQLHPRHSTTAASAAAAAVGSDPYRFFLKTNLTRATTMATFCPLNITTGGLGASAASGETGGVGEKVDGHHALPPPPSAAQPLPPSLTSQTSLVEAAVQEALAPERATLTANTALLTALIMAMGSASAQSPMSFLTSTGSISSSGAASSGVAGANAGVYETYGYLYSTLPRAVQEGLVEDDTLLTSLLQQPVPTTSTTKAASGGSGLSSSAVPSVPLTALNSVPSLPSILSSPSGAFAGQTLMAQPSAAPGSSPALTGTAAGSAAAAAASGGGATAAQAMSGALEGGAGVGYVEDSVASLAASKLFPPFSPDPPSTTFCLSAYNPINETYVEYPSLGEMPFGTAVLPCWLELALQNTAAERFSRTSHVVVHGGNGVDDEAFMCGILNEARAAAQEWLQQTGECLSAAVTKRAMAATAAPNAARPPNPVTTTASSTGNENGAAGNGSRSGETSGNKPAIAASAPEQLSAPRATASTSAATATSKLVDQTATPYYGASSSPDELAAYHYASTGSAAAPHAAASAQSAAAAAAGNAYSALLSSSTRVAGATPTTAGGAAAPTPASLYSSSCGQRENQRAQHYRLLVDPPHSNEMPWPLFFFANPGASLSAARTLLSETCALLMYHDENRITPMPATAEPLHRQCSRYARRAERGKRRLSVLLTGSAAVAAAAATSSAPAEAGGASTPSMSSGATAGPGGATTSSVSSLSTPAPAPTASPTAGGVAATSVTATVPEVPLETLSAVAQFIPCPTMPVTLRESRVLRRVLFKALQRVHLVLLWLTFNVDEAAARPTAYGSRNAAYFSPSLSSPVTGASADHAPGAASPSKPPQQSTPKRQVTPPADVVVGAGTPGSTLRGRRSCSGGGSVLLTAEESLLLLPSDNVLEGCKRRRYGYLMECFHYIALVYAELEGMCGHGYDACTAALLYEPHEASLWMLRASFSARQRLFARAQADLDIANQLTDVRLKSAEASLSAAATPAEAQRIQEELDVLRKRKQLLIRTGMQYQEENEMRASQQSMAAMQSSTTGGSMGNLITSTFLH